MTKHLIDGPLGKLTLASFVSLSFVLSGLLGKQNCFPQEHTLSIYYQPR